MSKKSRRSGAIAFRPRARLLKLIGEELISDEVVAISELVKNAHDADATSVTISFLGVTTPDGEISVRDDGSGMDRDTLLGRWMEPAASTKVGANRSMTPRGRRMLGEKGVGRFAADKLARCLEIVTRPRGNPDETLAVIDWDQFAADDRMLEEVLNRWEMRPAELISRHGTLLKMTGLRSTWSERMFRRLSIRLGRLLSPFREKNSFTIKIESDEFPEYSGELRSDILEKAPYWIEARFDGRQTISVKTNRTSLVQQRWNGHGELGCGPVRIRLYAFDLDGEALARIGPRMEVRAWLKEWTGISIYRDGFRIWPYGEPHDDWLRLDQRRVNNPVEHLSNNQALGFIDISRDGNPELMDQTNREGLMNNKPLEDLRRLVYFVLQLIEAERQSIRHPVKRPSAMMNGHKNGEGSIPEALLKLADKASGDIKQELRQISQKLSMESAEQHAAHQRFVEGCFGLAAIGQMTSGLLSVLPDELDQLLADLNSLRKGVNRKAGENGHDSFDHFGQTLTSMTARVRLVQAATSGNDRRRAIDVIAEVESYENYIEPLLEKHGVRLEVEYASDDVLRTEMRPETLHCLLNILTVNSLDWLVQVKERRIRIGLTADDSRCHILFSDSGPGIAWQIGSRIFEPLFSMKEGGRGMGLTIAKRLVESHGGLMYLVLDGRRKGAAFQILLPRKRSRATFYNGR